MEKFILHSFKNLKIILREELRSHFVYIAISVDNCLSTYIIYLLLLVPALGPVWAETRVQSGDWYGSGTLHPGQACHCFPPLFRCSHFSPTGASTSATTWEIPAAEAGTVILPKWRLPRHLGIFYTPHIYDMEGVLTIFSPLKIRRLRPGLNPRTLELKASTLSLDHRSRSNLLNYYIFYCLCAGLVQGHLIPQVHYVNSYTFHSNNSHAIRSILIDVILRDYT